MNEQDALTAQQLEERHGIRTVQDLIRVASGLEVSPSELLASVA